MNVFLSGIGAFLKERLKLTIGEVSPGFGMVSETDGSAEVNPDVIAQNEGLSYYRKMSLRPIPKAGLKHRNISYLWKKAGGIPSHAQRQGEIDLDPFDRDSWESPPQLLPASSEEQDLNIWLFLTWNIDQVFGKDKEESPGGFYKFLNALHHNRMRFGFTVQEIDWQIANYEGSPHVIINNIWDRDPERFVKNPTGYAPGWYLKNDLYNRADLSPLPPRKFLIFNNGYLENPYGESELAGIVGSDYNKKHFKLWMGRHLEKHGSGQWVAKYNQNKYGVQGSKASEYRANLIASLKNLRNQGVCVLPGDKDGFPDIQIYESSGAGSLFVEALEYEDKQMAIALTGNDMAISHPSVGSHALAKSTTEVAKSEYEIDDLQAIQDALNLLIRWQVDFNWEDIDYYPSFQLIDTSKIQPTTPESKEPEPIDVDSGEPEPEGAQEFAEEKKTEPDEEEEPDEPVEISRFPDKTDPPDEFEDKEVQEEAGAYIKEQPVLTRKQFDKLSKEEKQGAFTITAVKDIKIIQELHQAIQATLNQPNEAAAWEKYKIDAKAILKKHGKRGVRMETLIVSFRVARNNAYSQAIMAKAKGLGAKVYGLLYNARHDNDTRVNHKAADGVLLPLNHKFWKSYQPANGFNCRCWLSIITKEMASVNNLRFTPDKDLPTARGLKPDQGFD